MKFKLVYVVHFFVFIIATYIYYIGITGFIEFMKFGGYSNYDFSSIIHSLKYSGRLHASVIISFPLLGVFLKNKLGWIFITFYFYFVLWFLLLQTFEESLISFEGIISFSAFASIFISLLIIMNMTQVNFDYYKVKNNKLLGINVIAFTIGLCISMIFNLSRITEYLV